MNSDTDTSAPRGPTGLVLTGLLLLTGLVYAPALDNGFINMDDPGYVTQNEHVRTGLTFPNLKWALTTLSLGFWQPLTLVSLQLDATLYGASAAGFHFTNVALHAGSAAMLYWWLLRATGQPGPAAVVAVFFALHPLHVESVAWVTERKDVLSTLILLVTLLAYQRYAEGPSKTKFLLVVISFFLGLTAKPMLVTLPVLLLLLDWWPLDRGRRWHWLVLEKLPLLVLAGLFTVLTFYAHGPGSISSLEQFGPEKRLINMAYSWGWYLEKTLLPVGLMAFYPHEHFTFFSWPVLSRLALVVGGLALLLWAGRGSRACWVGVLWYVITLLPVGGLLQVGETARADRFVYVPHIGLFLAATWTLADQAQRWPALRSGLIGLTCFAVLGCAGLTWNQVKVWRSDATLWSHALAIKADHFWAHHEMGKVYHDQYRDLPRARKHFEEELRLTGGNTRIFSVLALICFEENKLDDARSFLDRSLVVYPNDAPALLLYGTILSQQNKTEQAVEYFRKAHQLDRANLRIARDLANTLNNLAQIQDSLGNNDKGQKLRKEAEDTLLQASGHGP